MVFEGVLTELDSGRAVVRLPTESLHYFAFENICKKCPEGVVSVGRSKYPEDFIVICFIDDTRTVEDIRNECKLGKSVNLFRVGHPTDKLGSTSFELQYLPHYVEMCNP